MVAAPNTRVGRLTEHIMAPLYGSILQKADYNKVYGRVMDGLKTAEEAGVTLCPDNDQALWSKYCALSRKAKRAILAMMTELDKP